MGAADFVVELSIPSGPSTGGGKQALQHLRLVPRRPGYAAIIVGTVDTVKNFAELRTFEHVAIHHEVRFGRPLEVTSDEYADFLRKADVILNLARVGSSRSPAPAELLEAAKIARSRRKVSLSAIALFVVVMVIAAAVVYRIALALRT